MYQKCTPSSVSSINTGNFYPTFPHSCLPSTCCYKSTLGGAGWRDKTRHYRRRATSKFTVGGSTKSLVLACDVWIWSRAVPSDAWRHRTPSGLCFTHPFGYGEELLSSWERGTSSCLLRYQIQQLLVRVRIHCRVWPPNIDYPFRLNKGDITTSLIKDTKMGSDIQCIQLLHSAGKNANALSRLHRPQATSPVLVIWLITFLPQPSVQPTDRDPLLSQVKKYVSRGWPHQPLPPEFKPYLSWANELRLLDGCLMWGSRMIVRHKVALQHWRSFMRRSLEWVKWRR